MGEKESEHDRRIFTSARPEDLRCGPTGDVASSGSRPPMHGGDASDKAGDGRGCADAAAALLCRSSSQCFVYRDESRMNTVKTGICFCVLQVHKRSSRKSL